MRFKRLFLTITFLLNFLLISFAQEPMLLDHSGGVRTVEFSPVNASLVASAGESNIIKLWNLQNDTVRTLVGHTSRVNSITFSPNGELLASVSNDKTLRLWNVQSQQNIATRNLTDRYQSIAFSPDGQLLATGGGRHVKLWNSRHQTEIATLQHSQDVRTVAFSHDSQLLAAGDGSGDGPGTVKVWDVKSRQVVVSLNANPKNIKAVEFSSDNRYLASSGWNGYLKIWDTSNWELLRTIPNTEHYDIAFSPDGKMIASTSNGSVSLWWVGDGTKVVQLPGPTDWIHPIDFSHDGTSLVVGAEDGILRIWDIHTSMTDTGKDGDIRILHVDTYLQQLPKANSVRGGNIPEPAPLPAVVRDYFELDPFYQQWIDVEGFPVIASAQVNPYALKEAAWLIDKMIGHRQDLLHALIQNKVHFTVVGYTEMTTQIPEHSHLRPAFYWDRRKRGGCTEENLLAYPGDTASNGYQLIHRLAHTVHHVGLNTVAPQFDDRLKIAYDAAMKKRLWQGSYAASNRDEYWAEGTNAWIDPKGGSSFRRVHGGNTRTELKRYDPNLAMLLTEIYGDRKWRYTPVATRTHLPHLRGFNPQDSPTFKWPKRLEEAYAQLRDPSINRGNEWINLNPYNPNQLSQLIKSKTRGNRTHVLIVNLAEIDVLVYQVLPDGAEIFKKRIPANRGLRHAEIINTHVSGIYLVKDQNDRNIAVFRAEAETGRALIGASISGTNRTAQRDISDNVSQPRALIAQSQRPPMYWIDAETGTLHRLVGAKVETLVPSVQGATSLAVDMVDGKLYWTEKTSDRTGRIRRANLDSTNVQFVKDLTSVPLDLALDAVNGKLYVTNAWGKVQRLNVDGSGFQPDLITGLDTPMNLVMDITNDKLYWTEKTSQNTGRIRSANLDGINVQLVKDFQTSVPLDITLDATNGKLYWLNPWKEGHRMNVDGSGIQPNFITGLDTPTDIAVDPAGQKFYITSSDGKISRRNLNGGDSEEVVTGLGNPSGLVFGGTTIPAQIATPPATPDRAEDVNQDKKVNKSDLLLVVTALGEKSPANPSFDVNADGAVNIADVLLVIEALDDPVAAAAPSFGETRTALDPTRLAMQLDILRAESDGSLKYEHAIAFFESLLTAIRPTETRLLANYPNPFNPETWIPYQLSKPMEVTLRIYAVNGALIRTLALGHQPAGVYHSRTRAAYWDGKNEVDESVASGVYFYTLSARDFTSTRKMFIRK